MRWDIFCKVIDNHGDIGVCWRLAADLGARGEQVRLWVDDPTALSWMAPRGSPGVAVLPWNAATPMPAPGDVLVEAFGCDPAPDFVAAHAAAWHATGHRPVWINLEYLSAESFAERSHGLPSPVLSGPGAGLTKYFFYPGFTSRTGGLLRETDLAWRQAQFDRSAWRAARGGAMPGAQAQRWVSLFCYEPPALVPLLRQLATGAVPTRLLVTAGRASAATRQALVHLDATQPGWNHADRLALDWLPLMEQPGFDELLWACDFNFVRGEDSLVRAIWAGQPFAWQIYEQHDQAHHDKLAAFLGVAGAPPSWRQFHEVWNGLSAGPLPRLDTDDWKPAAADFRARLLAQPDLASQLIGFVTEKR